MPKNPSNNHDLPRPNPGDFDGTWGTDVMNDDMTQKLEERLVARDTEANLSNYTPYDEAIFVATDTGAVYDGDGSSWNKAERDFQKVTTEALEAGQADITNETLVIVETASDVTGLSANSSTSPDFGTPIKDERNEFDAASNQFTPDETGFYFVFGRARTKTGNGTDGDLLKSRFRNAIDGNNVIPEIQFLVGGAPSYTAFWPCSGVVKLTGGEPYKFQVANADSSVGIASGGGKLMIRRALR